MDGDEFALLCLLICASGTTPSGRTGAAAQIVNGKVKRTREEGENGGARRDRRS